MKSWRIINIHILLLLWSSLLLLRLLLLMVLLRVWLIMLLDLLFLHAIILLLDRSTSIICSCRCIPQIESIKRPSESVTPLVCVAQILNCSRDLGRLEFLVSLNLTTSLQLTDHTRTAFLLNLFVNWLILVLIYDFNEILVADIAYNAFLI